MRVKKYDDAVELTDGDTVLFAVDYCADCTVPHAMVSLYDGKVCRSASKRIYDIRATIRALRAAADMLERCEDVRKAKAAKKPRTRKTR